MNPLNIMWRRIKNIFASLDKPHQKSSSVSVMSSDPDNPVVASPMYRMAYGSPDHTPGMVEEDQDTDICAEKRSDRSNDSTTLREGDDAIRPEQNSADHTDDSVVDQENPETPKEPIMTMENAVKVMLFLRRWVNNGKEPHVNNDNENSEDANAKDFVDRLTVKPEEDTKGTVYGGDSTGWSEKLKYVVMGTIKPASTYFYAWSSIVALTYMYNCLFIICRFAFVELQDRYEVIWYSIDYITDVVNIMDILIQLRIGYLEEGILVTDPALLAKNYIKSRNFIVDCVSVIPTDVFYFAFGSHAHWIRLNRLIKFRRFAWFAESTESRTSVPNFFRIFRLLMNIFVIFHWNACVYFLISRAIGFGHDRWVFRYEKIVDPSICTRANATNPKICDERYLIPFSNLTKQYVFSLYWSALILTTIGEQEAPVTIPEHMFVISDILIGLLIFASIVGNVGSMISNINAGKAEFQENMDGAKTYIENRNVVKPLGAKTISWFNYIWSQGQSLDESSILDSLPTKLKAELAIQVHLETLKRVHIFKDTEPGLLVELVLKLRLQIFSPGDFICRKGDVGKEMYIVKSGSLNVVSEDGKKVFVTLKEGSVFGELSVMNIPGNKTGNRRSASIKSVGYSDLFVLSKDDLWSALKEYPNAREILMEKGKTMLRKDNLLDDTAEELDHEKDVGKTLDLVERRIKDANEGVTEMYNDFIEVTNSLKRKMDKLEKIAKEVEEGLEN